MRGQGDLAGELYLQQIDDLSVGEDEQEGRRARSEQAVVEREAKRDRTPQALPAVGQSASRHVSCRLGPRSPAPRGLRKTDSPGRVPCGSAGWTDRRRPSAEAG